MIKIIDWTGKILFQGHHKDKEINTILKANRCNCHGKNNLVSCKECEDTGYLGDFSLEWIDENNQENVYECVEY